MHTVKIIIRPIKGAVNKCLLTLVDNQEKLIDFWKMNIDVANRMSRDQTFFNSSHYKARIDAAVNKVQGRVNE